MSGGNTPQSGAFISKALRTRLDKDKEKEIERLRDLSEGLDWIKGIIDKEREKQMTSKLLTLKLLYAGYFGSKGRSAKYARNPCAVREALKYCRENKIPPPDWALKYIYDLMSGEETPPTERDEKRWANLMRLLDIAAEWDKKSQLGMTDSEIQQHFRRKGISDTPLQYAKAFLNPQSKKMVYEFSKDLDTKKYLDLTAEIIEEAELIQEEVQKRTGEDSPEKKQHETATIEGEPA